MDGITFDPTEFISSPYFWRALLLVLLLWFLKNARQTFDGLRYVFDNLMTMFAKRKNETDRLVAEVLRQKTQNGDRFDAKFAVNLQAGIIEDKDAEIADLKRELLVAKDRNGALTRLAVESGEKNVEVIQLLNGTVGMFNTVAERLTLAIDRLCDAVNGNKML